MVFEVVTGSKVNSDHEFTETEIKINIKICDNTYKVEIWARLHLNKNFTIHIINNLWS